MPLFREEVLDFLGTVGIYQIVMPTPFPQAGDVYSFLIRREDKFILFDAGLKTEEAKEAFFHFIKKYNIDLWQIEKIILSHGHIDHYGLASFISEKSGAKIFIHEKDRLKVHKDYLKIYDEGAAVYHEFFVKNGMPEKLSRALIEVGKNFNFFADQLEDIDTVDEGDIIEYDGGRFRVIHLPGHTPGCIGLHDEERGIMLGGDTLLAKISPNPIIELGEKGEEERFKSLPTYFSSLKRIESLSLKMVIPAHGECITEPSRTIATLRKFYSLRQRKILHVLENGPLTPFELAVTLFPERKNEIFLIFSEVIGNLDMLEEEGRVEKEERNGKIYYRRSKNELAVNR